MRFKHTGCTIKNMFAKKRENFKSKQQELLDYYSETANLYDSLHVDSNSEHSLALHYLAVFIKYYRIETILDVGAGTGESPAS